MIVAIILSSALSVLVLVLALLMPTLTRPTVPFGVRVPAQRVAEPAVARQTRSYRARVLVGGIAVAAVGVVSYGLTGETLLLPLTVLVLIGVWYGSFFLAHHEIQVAKVEGDWYEGVHQAVAVDTELRTDPPRFPWLWLAPPVVITLATVVIGIVLYPSMPAALAVHYGAKGVPNRLAAKSIGTAFSLVFVQIGVTALLAGIAAGISRSRADIDPAHPVGSARWHRRYMALGAKALLGLVAMIDLGMLASSLLTWTGTVTALAQLVVVIPILLGVAIAIIVLARNNREPADGAEQDTGLAHRDDDQHWRGGMFYINREDHALLVPRRVGLGWTINFGNPRVAMLAAGVIALIVLLITIRFTG